jgi:hypothetical protein
VLSRMEELAGKTDGRALFECKRSTSCWIVDSGLGMGVPVERSFHLGQIGLDIP